MFRLQYDAIETVGNSDIAYSLGANMLLMFSADMHKPTKTLYMHGAKWDHRSDNCCMQSTH